MPRFECRTAFVRVSVVTVMALGAATGGLPQEADSARLGAAPTRLWFALASDGEQDRLLVTNHGTLEAIVRLIGLPGRESATFALQPGTTAGIDAGAVFPNAALVRVEADGLVEARAVGAPASTVKPGLVGLASEFELRFERGADTADRRVILVNPWARSTRAHVVAGERPLATLAIPAGAAVDVPLRASGAPSGVVHVSADVAISGLGQSFGAGGELQEVAVGAVSLGPPWSWPFGDGWVGHGYAEIGARIRGLYHTALDMQANTGAEVKSVCSGTLHKIQLNGGKEGSGTEDHGFGNTVIIRANESLFGQPVYVQYSHLASVRTELLAACGPVDAGRTRRRTCTRYAPVAAGDILGIIGNTGGNYGIHLHLEVKSFGTLGPAGDANAIYGYSSVHPDTPNASGARYFNPMLRFHDVTANLAAVRLRSRVASEPRIGPGGRGVGVWPQYDPVETVGAGEELDGWVQAPATPAPACARGWYLVRRRNGKGFPDHRSFNPPAPSTPTLPEAWVCSDDLESSEAAPSPAPTPTPGPSPTPAPQPTPSPRPSPPQVSGVTPSSVVGSEFTMTVQGTGFDASGASVLVYQANGSYMGSGAVTNRSTTRITARQSMAGAAPGAYTVRVRNSSGELSNPASFSLFAQVNCWPPNGPAGTQFSYTGQGFTGRYGVTSHLRRPNGTEFGTLQIPTDGQGRFTHAVNSSGFAAGVYELWAEDNNTRVVTSRVTFRVQ